MAIHVVAVIPYTYVKGAPPSKSSNRFCGPAPSGAPPDIAAFALFKEYLFLSGLIIMAIIMGGTPPLSVTWYFSLYARMEELRVKKMSDFEKANYRHLRSLRNRIKMGRKRES